MSYRIEHERQRGRDMPRGASVAGKRSKGILIAEEALRPSPIWTHRDDERAIAICLSEPLAEPKRELRLAASRQARQDRERFGSKRCDKRANAVRRNE